MPTPRSSASSPSSWHRRSRSCSTPRSISPHAAGRPTSCRPRTAPGRSSPDSTCAATRRSSSTPREREARIPLTPNRPVAEVTRERSGGGGQPGRRGRDQPEAAGGLLDAFRWTRTASTATYDPDQVATYFGRRLRRPWCLTEFRAPFRGRATPVNAWWGTFDLAVRFFSGKPADPPGDDFILRNARRRGGDPDRLVARRSEARRAGLLRLSPIRRRMGSPTPTSIPRPRTGIRTSANSCSTGRTSASAEDPHALALEFVHSAFAHACEVCAWDPVLAQSAEGEPPPIH